MGKTSVLDETYCEAHGSDINCCIPCANERGVERIGSDGLDLHEIPVSRPMKARYEGPCRWPACDTDIEQGDMIVGIDPHGFVHWHHVG